MSHDGEVRRRVEEACLEFEKDLRAFLLGVLRDVHLTDDAFQRTVVKAIETCDKARPEFLRGWLFQIALNEGRQLRRNQRRQTKLVQKSVWSGLLATGDPETQAGQVASLLSEERRDAVQRAVADLPAEQQDVVIRRIHRNQTFAEIAADLDCPIGTVLTRMRRALRRLQEVPGLKDLADS